MRASAWPCMTLVQSDWTWTHRPSPMGPTHQLLETYMHRYFLLRCPYMKPLPVFLKSFYMCLKGWNTFRTCRSTFVSANTNIHASGQLQFFFFFYKKRGQLQFVLFLLRLFFLVSFFPICFYPFLFCVPHSFSLSALPISIFYLFSLSIIKERWKP